MKSGKTYWLRCLISLDTQEPAYLLFQKLSFERHDSIQTIP